MRLHLMAYSNQIPTKKAQKEPKGKSVSRKRVANLSGMDDRSQKEIQRGPNFFLKNQKSKKPGSNASDACEKIREFKGKYRPSVSLKTLRED